MSEARFIVGDVFEELAKLPDASIDVLVTSPPFLALRSYLPSDHPDKAKEIGSEPTPAAFLDTLLDLTAEWRRVLAPHGSICVELGDTYAGSGGAGGDYHEGGFREGQPGFVGSASKARDPDEIRAAAAAHWRAKNERRNEWPMDKSLTGIPSLYAFSLAYGRNLLNPEHVIEPWRVRNLIVWARPNPPVGALGDKVRPSTSYVTTACVSRTRYFDLDAERQPSDYHRPNLVGKGGDIGGVPNGRTRNTSDHTTNANGAPPLDHWIIPTEPYSGAHYATWPSELARKLISLMCPKKVCVVCGEPSRRLTLTDYPDGPKDDSTRDQRSQEARRGQGLPPEKGWRTTTTTTGWTDCGHSTDGSHWRRGIVLDPFAGSGTTLAVATGMGLDAIGIDLDSRNLDLARERVGMFLRVDEGANP